VDYEATDIDPTGDTFTWSLHTNASWLSINMTTGNLSGTPSKTDSGTYWVEVTVRDGKGGLDVTNFTITVPKVPITPPPPPENKRPVITTDNVHIAYVGDIYSVDYEAKDDDTPLINLTWSVTTNATWLTINSSTGVLSGVPGDSDVGTYNVNVTVSDGEGGLAFTNFILTVKYPVPPPKNKRPELSKGKISPSEGNTDTEFTFSVIYTDADNDPGEVWVWIDGDKKNMTSDPNDSDYTDGVEYTYTTTLSADIHKYYFTASDGKDDAIAGDNTPITKENALSTPKVTEVTEEPEDGKEKEDVDNTMVYLALVIVIIIILALLVYAMSRRKKEEPTEEEEPIDEEEAEEKEIPDEELEEEEE